MNLNPALNRGDAINDISNIDLGLKKRTPLLKYRSGKLVPKFGQLFHVADIKNMAAQDPGVARKVPFWGLGAQDTQLETGRVIYLLGN